MLNLKPEALITSRAGGVQLLYQILQYEPLKEIFGNLSREGFTPAIFGGALRDTLLFSENPKDIDVVVSGKISMGKLEAICDMEAWYEKTQTSFGALRYQFTQPNFQLDIWPLEHTWAVKQGYANSLQDLPYTTILNSEAVLYCPNEEIWLTGETECATFNACLEQKWVEKNSDKIPSDAIAMKKMVKLLPKFDKRGFTFGPKLKKYLWGQPNAKTI